MCFNMFFTTEITLQKYAQKLYNSNLISCIEGYIMLRGLGQWSPVRALGL